MKNIIRQSAFDITDVNFKELSNGGTSESIEPGKMTSKMKKILGVTGCMVATVVYFGMPEKPKNIGISEKPETDIQGYSMPSLMSEGDILLPLTPMSREAIRDITLSENGDSLVVTYRPNPDGPIFSYTTRKYIPVPKEICVSFFETTDTPGLSTLFTRCLPTNQ